MSDRYFLIFWMRCLARRGWLAARGLALVLAGLTPAGALACGMPLSARIPAEQALISFADGREEIVTSVHLQGDTPGAAVVFPVPGEPEVSALPSNGLFEYLADVTQPEVITREVAFDPRTPLAAGGAPGGGVSVLGREVLGGYDVARLAADDPNALQGWLVENGYSIPPGAAPILRAYIDEGWKFVAVKLAGQNGPNGALTPLRMAFDAREIVYPMRLGALSDRPVNVLLYVLSDHRVDIPQMTTEYAGPVAQLGRRPPADLAGLFRAPYLTKLRNSNIAPSALTADFVARQAPTDEPYRMVVTRTVYVEATPAPGAAGVPLSPGAVLGLGLAIMSSMIALGLAFGIRRQIDRVAPPPPDEDED
jgi:hypothetical protein